MAEFDDIGGRRRNLTPRKRNRQVGRITDALRDGDFSGYGPGRGKPGGSGGGGGGDDRPWRGPGGGGPWRGESSGGGSSASGGAWSPPSGSYMGGAGNGRLQAVIDAAIAQIGIPYSWGGGGKGGASRGIEHGANINGFDCSGLLDYAYHKGAGIDIGGTSAEQRNKGVGVSVEQAQAGDLIYWKRPGVSHIAMYLGNGYMIEAPRTGQTVRVTKVGGKNSFENATSIRRIIQDGGLGAEQGGRQFAGEFERLVWGIREQESNHRYDTVGAKTRKGDRAYGAYQIMGNHLGDWTKEAIGKRMTPEEFLADKDAQDRTARYHLKKLYDKYGVAAAAAGWFGGEGAAMKYHKGGNSHDPVAGFGTRQYAKEVMEKMNRAPAPLATDFRYNGGGGADGNYGTGGEFDADLDRRLSEEDMEAAFAKHGFSSFVINSDKELKQIFRDAVSKGWTEELFMQKIKGSKWYRGRSDKQREYDTIRLTDPKTWADNIHDQKEQIRTLANNLGIALTDDRMDAMAKSALRNGFTGDELSRAVAAEFNYDKGASYRGEAGDTINKVRDLAHAYGVQPTKEHMAREVKRVLRGENTLDGLKNDYINRAKSRYAHFATELDAGSTLEQIATPYMQSMSQILELNPEDVNIHDQTIQRGLARKDPKTNAASAMTLWEYEEHLKNDDRWLKTNNARESMMSVGSDLLRSFGLKV